MAMWAIMGVGMLINTLQQAGQTNQMRGQLEAQNAQLAKSLKESAGFLTARKGPEVKSTFNFDFQTPPFPDKNYKNLQDMQMGHAETRQNFTNNLQKDIQDMKSEFFGSNHYETQVGADGKHQVAVGEDGQPVVAKGPENADQKLARLQFESTKKTEQADRHANQRETFATTERQNVKEFLAQNREQLGNPYVQGELQKMVVDTKKKALQLQQNQEDERWKVDLPPVQEIAARVDGSLQQLRQMDQQHMQAEEESPDMKALLDHDQKVAAIMGEQRDLAQERRREEENAIMDPRKMMAAVHQAPAATEQPRDVGAQLPGYLAHSLYDMGIYTV